MQRAIAVVILALLTGWACDTAAPTKYREKREWGKPAQGLRCRIYTDPADDNHVANLVLEIENKSNESVLLPVHQAGDAVVPIAEFLIREEPEVRAARNRGWGEASYVLDPAEVLSARVSKLYHVAYGRITDSGWDRFDPENRPYHLTARVRIHEGHILSNTISVILNDPQKNAEQPNSPDDADSNH